MPALAMPLDDQAAQLQVLLQQRLVVAVGVPARLPGAVDAEAEADGMYFMTHAYLPILDDDGDVACAA